MELNDCPRCNVGRIRLKEKPYVQLYQGHLFVIPHAALGLCDICGYYEWDDKSIETLTEMVFHSNPVAYPKFSTPVLNDEEVLNSSQFPHSS